MSPSPDPTRRDFLRITGLATAGAATGGIALPEGFHTGPLRASGRLRMSPAGEAVAKALGDAGVGVVTSVPATGAWEVFAHFHRLKGGAAVPSLNEEPAFTMAHGAALTGTRSATILKSHGLAKAGNSVVDSLTSGTTAGFVVVVSYDSRGRHSDSIFPVIPFLEGIRIPFKNPIPENLYRETVDAFLWSESLGLPVALVLDVESLEREVGYTPLRVSPFGGAYARDPYRHVLCPPLTGYQNQVLSARLQGGDWRDVTRPELRAEPSPLPPAWQETARAYQPFFDVFTDIRRNRDPERVFVTGDTGVSSLFAFPPYDAIDACTYYGGSVPLALGALMGGYEEAWALTGDFSFVAAGHMGLLECLNHDLPLKVVVLHNGGAMTTGGQKLPAGSLAAVLDGYRESIRVIHDPTDREEMGRHLRGAAGSGRMDIVLVDYLRGAGLPTTASLNL